MVWFGLALGGCSTLNPDFDLREDSATDTEPFDPTSTSTSTSSAGGSLEESSGVPLDMLQMEPDRCIPAMVSLIEGCLHAAELSKPMDTEFEAGEFWLHPVKSDMLIFCTSTPGGIDTNLWSGDSFLEMIGGVGPGIDPAEAYFEHTCSTGEFEWCEGTLADFRADVMQACVEEFQVGFAFDNYEPGPVIAEAVTSIREMYLGNDCAGRCERELEVLAIPPKVAPTTGGDAVREMLEKFVLTDTPELTRFDDGYLLDAPFAMPYGMLQAGVGAETGWIAVTFLDHGPTADCGDYQHRAMVAVHHERRLLVKMSQSECLVN